MIDLYSRKVVGWAIADHLRTELVTQALQMALTHRRPPAGVIFHTDRGAQYTSKEHADFCQANNVRRSLGRSSARFLGTVPQVRFHFPVGGFKSQRW